MEPVLGEFCMAVAGGVVERLNGQVIGTVFYIRLFAKWLVTAKEQYGMRVSPIDGNFGRYHFDNEEESYTSECPEDSYPVAGVSVDPKSPTTTPDMTVTDGKKIAKPDGVLPIFS